VFDLSGVGGVNPPLVEDNSLLVTVKFGLVWGRIRPHRMVKNPNLSLNGYKLMSDIIQTHLQKLFL